MPHGPSPRIQITGRARAGKSTLRDALSLLSARETAPLDVPGRADPILDADLVLYVLPGAANSADRRLLATLSPARTLVVLNKADAIGCRWPDAAAVADRLTRVLGHRTFPVVAALAARTRTGTFTPADLHTLHRHRHHTPPAFTLLPELFTDPSLATDAPARQTLLDRWTLYGVACALTALNHAPTLHPRPLLQILHSASGIDPLHEELHTRYVAAATRLAESAPPHPPPPPEPFD
ncbi:hypothetical protein [Nocardia sp. NPDC005978]|uniref:hypothetical protein n=1 Tax=unclassified Nocardia TaxID=2637762 RepID=UPI0033B354FF